MLTSAVIKKIKIVIADYSSFSRLVLADILNAEVDLEVLDTAGNGDELVQLAAELQPDLIIADYHLPKNGRMYTFRRIRNEFGIPILMMIGKDGLSDDYIFEAMKVGVYDYVKIASHTLYPQFRNIQEEIILKVRAVMDIKAHQDALLKSNLVIRRPSLAEAPALERSPRQQQATSFVVIGASTGGTKAIECIVKALRQDLPAVVLIALHLPDKFTKTFTQRLRRLTTLKVLEGKPGTRLLAGKIIVAPGNKNMIITQYMGIKNDLRIDFSDEPSNEYDRPSIDILMKSVARLAGKCTLGVILTGMGQDGTAGVKAILSKGGDTIAQDQASSAIFGMAKSAIDKGYITKVLGLTQIPDYINRFAEYHRI